MALSEICIIEEVIAYLGKGTSLTDKERGLLTMIKPTAETKVRQYCQYGITQQTYTHFLPEANPLDIRDGLTNLGYGGPNLSFPNLKYLGPILQLPEAPAISITSVNVDRGGYAGKGTNAFASSTALTEGTEFILDELQASFSATAHLIRLGTSWPSVPRSVKVVYVAGWTAAHLQGDVTDWRLDASDIRMATIKTIIESFNEAVNQQSGQGGSGGAIKSEKIGDYSVTYDTTHSGPAVEIPDDAKLMLDRFRRADTLVM